MSAIELGSGSLTLEGLYQVCFCRLSVVLSTSVLAVFSSRGEGSTDSVPFTYATLFSGKYYDMPAFFSRAYVLTMLSLLVNSPGSVSLDTLQILVKVLNGPKDLALQRPELVSLPNARLEQDVFDQVLAYFSASVGKQFHSRIPQADIDTMKLNTHAFTLSVTFLSSALLSLVATVQEAALAFSFEVLCAQTRELFDSTNYTVYRKLKCMQRTVANVMSLVSGSKKLNQKESNLHCSQFIVLAGETRELATALRTAAQTDIGSAAYVSSATRPLADATIVALLHAVHIKVPTIRSASAVRSALSDTVPVEKGIWKALPNDAFEKACEAFDDALKRELTPVIHSFLLPMQLCSTLKQLVSELFIAFAKLTVAQESLPKGRVQVGQGTLIAMDTYGDLFRQCHAASGAEWFACVLQIAHALTDHLFLAISSSHIPQPPCGMRDLLPGQMVIRQRAMAMITDVFQRHGALAIETPVMESRAVLMGKYGEDQKLIYNIADYGEEPLSLRYDLTVPFARYCATYREKAIKRYSIGRVYRRDKPVMEKGRFREFYQCDMDIAYEPGTQAPMLADAEIITIIFEILHSLRTHIGAFQILLSHRTLLDIAMTMAGVSDDKKKAMCSCIDQLDKLSKEEVRDKIINEKGISPAVTDIMLSLIAFQHMFSLAAYTDPSFNFAEHLTAQMREAHVATGLDRAISERFLEAIRPTMDQMALLLKYASLMCPPSLDAIVLDLSLARGLDYYTGMIFEAKMVAANGERTSSIAGGGRYDELLGRFRAKGDDLCAVGGSIGIERIFAILEAQCSGGKDTGAHTSTGFGDKADRARTYDIYICAAPGCSLEARLRLAGMLWKHGISVGMNHKESSSQKLFKKDLDEAISGHAVLALILGGDEVEQQVVNVKDLATAEQVVVPFSEVEEHCIRALSVRHERFALATCQKLIKGFREGRVSDAEIESMLGILSSLSESRRDTSE